MKKRISLFAFALFAFLFANTARAQLPPFRTTALLPMNPTSADNLKLSMQDRTCGGTSGYKANPYRVGMSQNNITVTLGERVLNPMPLCPGAPREEMDLGRLPAGNYTLTVVSAAVANSPATVVFENEPFTVTDARAAKTAPYVRLDYSGHWWDPNDSGWGLFIWHDARDNVLAAWFTYTPDGKPMWYVFQPKWESSASPRFIGIGIMVSTVTFPADLMQTGRMPGPTSPPPNPTSLNVVGTAKLDFTNFGTTDEGKLTYTFNGGATLTRNIQRFKP